MLQNANLRGWTIKPQGNDIYIDLPAIADLKLIRDNLPETLAAMALDIDIPHERLMIVFHNGHEHFEYVLNPDAKDLDEGDE